MFIAEIAESYCQRQKNNSKTQHIWEHYTLMAHINSTSRNFQFSKFLKFAQTFFGTSQVQNGTHSVVLLFIVCN